MRKMIIVVVLLALVAVSSQATTVTMVSSDAQDTAMYRALPDNNYNGGWLMNGTAYVEPHGGAYTTLVRFENIAIPAGQTIVSATLRLKAIAIDEGSDPSPDGIVTLTATPLLKMFQETEATANQAAAGTPWETAMARGATDRGAPDGSTDITQAEMDLWAGDVGAMIWQSFDVTTSFAAQYAGGTYYGWAIDRLVPPAEGHDGQASFVWSDYGAAELDIEYSPMAVIPEASDPTPTHGASDVSPSTSLSWTPGAGAVSHHLIAGTGVDGGGAITGVIIDESGLTASNYTPATSFALATTYYWQVNEFDGGTEYTGAVWSFTTGGDPTASNPTPSDGLTGVGTTTSLGWFPGSGAVSHHLTVGTGLGGGGAITGVIIDEPALTSPGYSPTLGFDLATTYYWQVNEFDGATTYTGTVWSFTTATSYGSYYYVAPDAAAGGDGSIGSPFQTLEQARDAVLVAKATVVLRGGVYELGSSFFLDANDSGLPNDPVIYRSYPGETARLMGGKVLPSSSFQPVTSASPLWSRMDTAARANIVQISLPSAGITDYGTLTARSVFNDWKGALMLYFEGDSMTLARWPDEAPEDSPANHGGNWALSGYDLINTRNSDTQFTTLSDRLSRWTLASDIWAHGYFAWDWADFHVPVSSVNAAAKTITLGQAPGYGVSAGQHYFVYNLIEELTEPGEWYLDRGTGILYLWPPSDISSAEVYVSMLNNGPIYISNASWITFKDLVIEGGRDWLVNVSSGSDIEFTECTLRNAGTWAAYIGGARNGVTCSEIYNTGNGGVSLSGGDRVQLVPGSNYVAHTSIHDFGQWQNGYRPGVKMSGVGQIASHNEMYNGPHAGIVWDGNDHLMEYNEFYNICRFAGDMGAIYAGRDWGYRGAVMRYNFMHDMYSWVDFGSTGIHGVYLDDCISGVEIFGNIMYRIAGFAVLHGGGRDTIVRNNIADTCGASYFVDNRGTTQITHGTFPADSWALISRIQYAGISYQSGIWASTYPELAAIPPDHALGKTSHWTHPEGSVFSGNYSWNSPYGNPAGVWEHNNTGDGAYANIMDDYFDEHINNQYGADPLFVDPANLDMRLQPGSPVYNIPGWQEIPFLEIGIVKPPDTFYVQLDDIARGAGADDVTVQGLGRTVTHYWLEYSDDGLQAWDPLAGTATYLTPVEINDPLDTDTLLWTDTAAGGSGSRSYRIGVSTDAADVPGGAQ